MDNGRVDNGSVNNGSVNNGAVDNDSSADTCSRLAQSGWAELRGLPSW
jgi:hypothetical protein